MHKFIISLQILIILFSSFLSPEADNNINDLKFIKHGEYVLKDEVLIYGEIKDINNIISDAVLYIYESDRITLKKTILFDDNNFETFSFLALVNDDNFIMVCEEYSFDQLNNSKQYIKTFLIEYNYLGEEIGNTMITDKFETYGNINYHLVIMDSENNYEFYSNDLIAKSTMDIPEFYLGNYDCQYQGQAYINSDLVDSLELNNPGIFNISIVRNDFSYSFNIVIEADVIFDGEIYESGYAGDLKIYSLGNMFLNGNTYLAGSSIEYPGNYELIVQGLNDYEKKVNFVLLPTIRKYDYEKTTQLIENEKISNPITIFSDGITMLLNGEPYSSRVINTPGEYEITVHGVNGYKVTIPFEIIPKISGIKNNSEYTSLNFSVFGEAYLNGELVSGNVKLDTPGEYKLEVFYNNNLFTEYSFTIIDSSNFNEEKETNVYLKYGIFVIIAIGVFIIFSKK